MNRRRDHRVASDINSYKPVAHAYSRKRMGRAVTSLGGQFGAEGKRFMRWVYFAAAFLLCSSTGFSQLSVEDAQRRLAARQSQRQATTQVSQPQPPPARAKFDIGIYPPALRQMWTDGEAARPNRIKWLQDELRKARIAQNHLQGYAQTATARNISLEIKQTYVASQAGNRDWIAQASKEQQSLQQPYTYMEVGKEQGSNLTEFDSEGYITCKFKVSQIMDVNNVLAFDDDVWITGISTANLVDDQTVTTRGMLVPAGTKRTTQKRRTDTKGGRYIEAAGVERTIRVMAITPVLPIPQDAWLAFNRVLLAPHTPPNAVQDPGTPPPPPPPPAEYHQIIGR